MCTRGAIYRSSYIGSLQCPYCPRLPIPTYHHVVTGSLQSFVIYKYFCAPWMKIWHVSTVSWRWRWRPLARRWPSTWPFTVMRPSTKRWPSAQYPIALRVLRPNRSDLSSDWTMAPLRVRPLSTRTRRCIIGDVRKWRLVKAYLRGWCSGSGNLRGLQPASPKLVITHSFGVELLLIYSTISFFFNLYLADESLSVPM
jgi:hypothetical protein